MAIECVIRVKAGKYRFRNRPKTANRQLCFWVAGFFIGSGKCKNQEIHELVRADEGVKSEICNVKSWDQADWLLWEILGEIMWCVTDVSARHKSRW